MTTASLRTRTLVEILGCMIQEVEKIITGTNTKYYNAESFAAQSCPHCEIPALKAPVPFLF